jgi:hypothetical protein
MDNILETVLAFSSYRKNIEVQKKILKDKLVSDLTVGYEGGMFRIDQSLISFVQFLISNNRIENVPIIDINTNPIIITNVSTFNDYILEVYFFSTNKYLTEFEKLKSKRNIQDFLKNEV